LQIPDSAGISPAFIGNFQARCLYSHILKRIQPKKSTTGEKMIELQGNKAM